MVAGNPTVYRVLSDPEDADSAYRGFAVRQGAHRGSAVDVNSYPVKGDTFAVQLIDRGRDRGSAARVGAHHAAAQRKVTCRRGARRPRGYCCDGHLPGLLAQYDTRLGKRRGP